MSYGVSKTRFGPIFRIFKMGGPFYLEMLGVIGCLELKWSTLWLYKMSYGVSKTRFGPIFRIFKMAHSGS
ncbi:hypothetical protein PV325_004822 [Microctonus aethiopoides]|nr:hypothetical protein PV325_004822 [Microctonus aethiopoides]